MIIYTLRIGESSSVEDYGVCLFASILLIDYGMCPHSGSTSVRHCGVFILLLWYWLIVDCAYSLCIVQTWLYIHFAWGKRTMLQPLLDIAECSYCFYDIDWLWNVPIACVLFRHDYIYTSHWGIVLCCRLRSVSIASIILIDSGMCLWLVCCSGMVICTLRIGESSSVEDCGVCLLLLW